MLDAHGKIAWGRTDIGDDPIVAVLTAQVADAHVAGLRQEGVSYIFAGEQDLDLGLALEILHRELGIQRVLLEGGGVTNGAFLRAGLIDELSLVIFPAVDGAQGAPCVFDSRGRCGRHISPAPRDDARKQSGTGGWGGVAALPTAERLTHACERLRPSHHCIERRGKCNYSRLIPRLFSSPGNPAQKQS